MKYILIKSRRPMTPGVIAFTAVLITVALTITNLAQQPGSLDPVLQDSQRLDSTPISSLLNVDGSLKPGVVGSFDPKGFRMITGPDGAPRFVADDSGNALSPAASCDDGWDDRFSTDGVTGSVSAIATDQAGNIYIGGGFQFVANVPANNIAKWNGTTWSILGSGVNGGVAAIAVSGNDVYVGGRFTTAGGIPANRIAKWDGISWSALGNGITGSVSGLGTRVFAVAVSGNDVYVGGDFTIAGGVDAKILARWDGSTWKAVGSGITGYSISAIAVSGDDVYVGGGFSAAGGIPANNIAKWNGTAWSALGSGVNGTAGSITVSGSDVYVGGGFGAAGGIPANNIAKWNGTTWSALGSGVNGGVGSIAVSGSDVYVGGQFGSADGVLGTRNIAKWNGTNWSAVDTGVDSAVYAIAVLGTDIYAGGYLTRAGGVSANGIAKWNGSDWSRVGPRGLGITGPPYDTRVTSVVGSGSDVYVGGYFTAAGEVSANNIAKWDGTSWSAMGAGLPYEVHAIAVSGNDVYAGTLSEGFNSNIFKWTGSAWLVLGSGVNPYCDVDPCIGVVNAIAISGTDIYVGGDFASAGGVPGTRGIVKWNGSTWSALGTGIGGVAYPVVNAIGVLGNDVYVGGKFTTAGAVTVNNIAKWNGTSWSALGPGTTGDVNDHVSAIAISGTDVYVGGNFSSVGGIPGTSGIAKWNGSSWSALGSGARSCPPSGCELPYIVTIVVSGADVYVGGAFNRFGDVVANNIVRWNGSSWSALRSEVSGSVYALAVSNSNLYAGGPFLTAGCHAASRFSRYRLTGNTPFDFDGDGRSDISVFRPSDSVWYLNRSSQGFFATQFGLAPDNIVPSDYDGDGKTDISIFRDGAWWRINSGDSTVAVAQFGIAGDIPVPGDYNGDGRDELAVYRSGEWWLEGRARIDFGIATDKPVPADYDGDGKTDISIYRDGIWWRINSSDSSISVVHFGIATDLPVVGDYDGDSKVDLAVYRDGTWHVLQSVGGHTAFNWGLSTDTPAPADYDGDGKTDAAVFRNGTWYLLNSTAGVSIQQFGLANDKPVPAAYVSQ